jgi:hypothetical protein
MQIEASRIQPDFELLPEYNISDETYCTARKMCEDFTNQKGERFGNKQVKKAFHYLKRNKVNFAFSSPEDIIQKYNSEISKKQT